MLGEEVNTLTQCLLVSNRDAYLTGTPPYTMTFAWVETPDAKVGQDLKGGWTVAEVFQTVPANRIVSVGAAARDRSKTIR